MPAISMFYGIVIYMYAFDNKRHKLPHIHARFQEDDAVFSITDGELLEGSLPKSKLRLVQAWIEIHKIELTTNWELAVGGNRIFSIKPLE